MQLLGSEWSELSPEAKAPFYAAAEAEKAVPLPAPPAKPVVKRAAPGAPIRLHQLNDMHAACAHMLCRHSERCQACQAARQQQQEGTAVCG